MDDALVVSGGEPGGDVTAKSRRLRQAHHAVGDDRTQILALNVLHHQAVTVVPFEDVVDAYDGRMVETRHRPRFAQETDPLCLITPCHCRAWWRR